MSNQYPHLGDAVFWRTMFAVSMANRHVSKEIITTQDVMTFSDDNKRQLVVMHKPDSVELLLMTNEQATLFAINQIARKGKL